MNKQAFYKTLGFCMALCLIGLSAVACSDDDIVPSATDPYHWNENEDVDDTVRPGDDFWHYVLGSWEKTVSSSKYYYSPLDHETECLNTLWEESREPVIQHLKGNLYKAAAELDYDLQLLSQRLARIDAISTPEAFYAETGRMLKEGYVPGFIVAPLFYEKKIHYYMARHKYSAYNASQVQRLTGYDATAAQALIDEAATFENLLGGNQQSLSAAYKLKELCDEKLVSSFERASQPATRSGNDSYESLFLQQAGLDTQWFFGFNTSDARKAYQRFFTLVNNEERLQLGKSFLRMEILVRSGYILNELLNGGTSMLETLQSYINKFADFQLSKAYADRFLTPGVRSAYTDLAEEFREGLKKRIADLEWMSGTTKQYATEKAEEMQFFIGYPDQWGETLCAFSGKSVYEDYLESMQKEMRMLTEHLGASDRDAYWNIMINDMPIYDWNACYYQYANALYIPGSQMLYEMFDPTKGDAYNYAIAGTTVGHEMVHGFDSNCASIDKNGVLNNWWTMSDRLEFKQRQQQLIDLYDQFEVLPGMYGIGEMTLSENMADLGGMEIAYQAFMDKKRAEGFYGEELKQQQRKFFMGFAHAWKIYQSETYIAILLAYEDVHAPSFIRVNGVVSQFDDWYELFDVQWGDYLYQHPEQRAHIW